MKFSRTAYTALPLPRVLEELVHECRLKDLPSFNADLDPRRHGAEHPDKVRVTITVERVEPHRKPKTVRNRGGYDVKTPRLRLV